MLEADQLGVFNAYGIILSSSGFVVCYFLLLLVATCTLAHVSR